MAFVIESVRGVEILDSRGRPTVKAYLRLKDGRDLGTSVPSGASTGRAETVELRDGDQARYAGMGCRRAVANVNEEIAATIVGRSFENQGELDRTLLGLDGSPNKSRLGANAILAVSVAFARSCAHANGVALHDHFASISKAARPSSVPLPRLMVNLFSGGKHAGGQIAIQDILVAPVAARTVDDGLSIVDAVYRAAEGLIARKYHMRSLKADEGGLAPSFSNVEEALSDAREAIGLAGFKLGSEVAIAIDVASSHFHREGRYHVDGKALDSAAMVDMLAGWVERFSILSVEDGLAEEDWAAWPLLRQWLAGRAMCLGDDLLCTNPQRIGRAIDANAADALLLKVNQIGTITEAADACRLARSAGWKVVVSARSGETEDDWLADLAVAWGDWIKVGSIRQSERLAKYNRLLEIEQQMT